MGENRTVKILNWNTEIASPRRRNERFLRVRETVEQHKADVICLTEAYSETMPEAGQSVSSDLSGSLVP
jgi:endonuclease/exonuclease/phosphatase family metal-dependent hydrolase